MAFFGRFGDITLPGPTTEEWGWQMHAACRGADPRVFFDTSGQDEEGGSAKRICARCPTIDKCLQYALDSNEPHGIWGGLSPKERRQYKWFHPSSKTGT